MRDGAEKAVVTQHVRGMGQGTRLVVRLRYGSERESCLGQEFWTSTSASTTESSQLYPLLSLRAGHPRSRLVWPCLVPVAARVLKRGITNTPRWLGGEVRDAQQ